MANFPFQNFACNVVPAFGGRQKSCHPTIAEHDYFHRSVQIHTSDHSRKRVIVLWGGKKEGFSLN